MSTLRPLPITLAIASLSLGGAANAQITGRVTDASRLPLHGVEVLFVVGDSVHAAARSDSAGSFSFRDARWGGALRLRRFGYRPRRVDADPGSDVQVVLETMPADLDAVRVISRIDDSFGRLREFYAHRAQSRFGHFFDREDIAEKKGVRWASDLMRFVPGARLIPGRIGSVVRLRGCRPLLWIDGVRVPGAELDEMVNMTDVEAVEVYPSFAGIPAQYVDRNTNCGAIVVWMKG